MRVAGQWLRRLRDSICMGQGTNVQMNNPVRIAGIFGYVGVSYEFVLLSSKDSGCDGFHVPRGKGRC